jgi:hypothetical protein
MSSASSTQSGRWSNSTADEHLTPAEETAELLWTEGLNCHLDGRESELSIVTPSPLRIGIEVASAASASVRAVDPQLQRRRNRRASGTAGVFVGTDIVAGSLRTADVHIVNRHLAKRHASIDGRACDA